MRRIFLILVMVSVSACSSMQPVSIQGLADSELPVAIQPGDRVEVITHDSEKFEFNVTDMDAVGLGGKLGFIPYERMRRLQVRRPGSSAEDLTWLWALLGIAAAAALIANTDSVTACSPGPCPPQ